MNSPLRASLALGCWLAAAAGQTAIVTDEVPAGFLPTEWVTAALKRTLSPQGRYVLQHGGPVRITDTREKIDAARRTLEEWQKAPALVPLELVFTTHARRPVQRLPVEPPVHDTGFPYPTRFDPPRIIMNGSGGFTFVPSQPRDFATRNVGSGTVANPAPSGYATTHPEVRLNETTTTSDIARRFSASATPGQTIALPVLPRVADPAALRALAVKLRAIDESEPAWTAAATELRIKPELPAGALVVNIVPHIVLAPNRRVPLQACAAAVLLAPAAPKNTGLLPRTDAEFYRLFLGTAPPDDAFTALTLTARVQYLGSPPR